MERTKANHAATSKRLLQIVVAVLSLSPTGFGAVSVLIGPAYLYGMNEWPVDLDSHFRFLSGIFLGIGLVFYSCVPSIERKTNRFRLALAVIFVGGLGRLLSLLVTGAPSTPHVVGLGLELVVVPILFLWQSRVAQQHA